MQNQFLLVMICVLAMVVCGCDSDTSNQKKEIKPQANEQKPQDKQEVRPKKETKPQVSGDSAKIVFTVLGKNTQGYMEYTHIQTGLVFVLIPSGTFRMGSPSNENGRSGGEGPLHEVELDSYLIAKYELTREVWTKVMGTSPWSGKDRAPDDPQCAATYISWDDCQEFCEKTSLQLPTEAQWERACRAGTTTRFYWGDDLSEGEIGEYAWYIKNATRIKEEYAHRVGQKRPNGFGLYDMRGNVDEWCRDWHDTDYYSKSPTNNPTGPSSGSWRVHRGGSFRTWAKGCRSAFRVFNSPDCRIYDLGVRFSSPSSYAESNANNLKDLREKEAELERKEAELKKREEELKKKYTPIQKAKVDIIYTPKTNGEVAANYYIDWVIYILKIDVTEKERVHLIKWAGKRMERKISGINQASRSDIESNMRRNYDISKYEHIRNDISKQSQFREILETDQVPITITSIEEELTRYRNGIVSTGSFEVGDYVTNRKGIWQDWIGRVISLRGNTYTIRITYSRLDEQFVVGREQTFLEDEIKPLGSVSLDAISKGYK